QRAQAVVQKLDSPPLGRVGNEALRVEGVAVQAGKRRGHLRHPGQTQGQSIRAMAARRPAWTFPPRTARLYGPAQRASGFPGGKESTSMLDKPFAASWRLSGRVGLQEALTLPRIAIESVEPAVEGGRFAAKAIVGQALTIGAVIFTDGHERMAAELLWRHAD